MKTTITSLFAAALLATVALPGAVAAKPSPSVEITPSGFEQSHVRFSADELITGPRR